ncbi:DUF6489 family protein [Nevskia sp.]|uniref:DUF6489 family protein n=1 Tax=Nevskia sp. TaxID=1929292 RepID=UPI0025EAB5EC|nr:DUF6489 family protein [Nevskia sp.]
MQIRIEIDVKPEELRRFLGLPDVAGLQEDLISFLRDKLGAAAETFDPASFVKDNLQTLRQSAPWQLLVSATARSSASAAAPAERPAAKRTRKRSAKTDGTTEAKTPRRRKTAQRKVAKPPSSSET